MTAVAKTVHLDVAENVLTIGWDDGHTSSYAGAYVRHICPCAGCRGHVPGEKPPPPWEQVKDVRLRHVEAVGTYALQFTLTDAHTSGIYTYPFLRENCPTNRDDVDETGRPLLA